MNTSSKEELIHYRLEAEGASPPSSARHDEKAATVLDDWLRDLLEEIKQGLQRLYRSRLKGVYLFGSYARGEADAESDVDVLVVLDEVTRYGREVERTGDLVSSLSLRYDVSISCVYLPLADWRRRRSPFLLNVREEAVAA